MLKREKRQMLVPGIWSLQEVQKLQELYEVPVLRSLQDTATVLLY